MTKEEMNKRTKEFAISIIRFCQNLPNIDEIKIIKGQILRSSTSVGANYRASNRAKSTSDMINKRKIVEEECDETMYWLELIAEVLPNFKDSIRPIYKEANEILSITVASIISLKQNKM
jgi:four helix bundle protein